MATEKEYHNDFSGGQAPTNLKRTIRKIGQELV